MNRRSRPGRTDRRRGEPGMAMLLVLLLIVLVSAAGVFAARTSSLEVRSSGYIRQAAQTHYVAESGVTASLEQFRRSCSAYLSEMQRQAATRTVSAGIPAGLDAQPLEYRFLLTDFARYVPSGRLFEAATGGSGSRVPGSFGLGAIEPRFVTTVSVIGQSNEPMFGFGVGGGRDFTVPMVLVELAADGVTVLGGVTDARDNSVGNEQARALVQVPCL